MNDPAVEAEFAALPETVVGGIIDGALHRIEGLGNLHVRTVSNLLFNLGGRFDLGHLGPGGWRLLFKPEIHLGTRPDKLVPDLAAWRCERAQHLFDDDAAALQVVPDWVCEVLSPSTEAIDRAKKMRIYLREGVGHVWLVNPVVEMVEVYRLERSRWTFVDTFEGKSVVRLEPFDAIDLELATFWAR